MIVTILLVLTLIVPYIYILVSRWRKNQIFWKSRGYPYLSRIDALRAFKNQELGSPNTNQRRFFKDWDKIYYKVYKGRDVKVGGMFTMGTPALILTDLDLMKIITHQDFDSFSTTRVRYEPKSSTIIWKMLSFSQGQEWTQRREILGPMFTSSKIKALAPLYFDMSQRLVDTIQNETTDDRLVNIQDITARYSVDTISALVFGYDANSLHDKNSIFYQLSLKNQAMTIRRVINAILTTYLPQKLKSGFGFSVINKEFLQFAVDCANTSIESRNSCSQPPQNNFLQLLVESMENGLLSKDLIVSQMIGFFMSGYDAVNSVLGMTCICIAYNPKVQEKLAQEIEEAFKGVVDYDKVNSLVYLQSVIFETLRLYPPATRSERVCTEPYVIPGSNGKTINKGTQMIIPIHAIHTDADYWENPDEFCPERFTEFNLNKNFFYMPFGHGKRNCIGMKLAMAEIKSALIFLIRHFEIHPAYGGTNGKDKDITQIIRQAVDSFKIRNGAKLRFVHRKRRVD